MISDEMSMNSDTKPSATTLRGVWRIYLAILRPTLRVPAACGAGRRPTRLNPNPAASECVGDWQADSERRRRVQGDPDSRYQQHQEQVTALVLVQLR